MNFYDKQRGVNLSVIRYVCEGSCHGKVTEEEYKEGKNVCGAKDCDHSGKPLVRNEYCSRCNTTFEEGEDHICF